MAMNSSERQLVARCALGLPVASLAVRAGLRQSWQRFAVPSGASRVPEQKESFDRALQVCRAVSLVARNIPFPSTCLSRSMVACRILAREGIPAELKIGARIVDGLCDAHAWVECGGAPVNESEDVARQFPPLARVPDVRAFQSR